MAKVRKCHAASTILCQGHQHFHRACLLLGNDENNQYNFFYKFEGGIIIMIMDIQGIGLNVSP